MRGHLTKRGKNSWTVVIELPRDSSTGKRRQQWATIKGTRKDAEKRLAELLHQLDTGDFVKPGKGTVAEFLRQWLRDYASLSVRPVSAEGYAQKIERHVIPEVGNVLLSELQAAHIQAFYRKALLSGRLDGKGGLSARTVLHIHHILHNALSCAVKWRLLNRNVCDTVDPPRAGQKQMKAMDADEVNRLLEASKGTIYYHLFHLAVFTGMRRSELLGLRWRDVDLDLATVSVSQVAHRLRGSKTVYEEPKTAKSKRQIALSPIAVIALREYRQQQEGHRVLLGILLTPDDLVFANPDGSPLLPNTVSHAFIKTVRRLGLPDVRFHDLRHTHATLMLRQGVNIKALQERLGHSTITTTLDVYAHVTPGMQREAALRFEEALRQGEIN